jgi:hormone-sensitive lipase
VNITKNFSYFMLTGWTGERICFAGDSAGGNIVISTALRAVSYQIRIPDGIVAAYSATLVQYTPSPARLLSMIDPLLPVGILTRCLAGNISYDV